LGDPSTGISDHTPHKPAVPWKTAVAYYRTSSAANVGADKDSLARQEIAVRAFAASAGFHIVHEYYDAAVSGADAVDARAGFAEMLTYMLGNGARTIIVETANRFARDLIVQETGYQMLKSHGIELIAVDAPESFLSDTPTSILIRQILGAVAQFEKTALVHKLRGARDRKRRATGRCEGRKAVPPEVIAAAAAHAATGCSLRAIARELAAQGMVAPSGQPYGPGSIAGMLKAASRLALS